MTRTSARTQNFTESVIRMMTRVALEHDAINLSQGFPDFEPPPELIQAAKDALDGPNHQYSITFGAPRFRQALADKLERFTGLEVSPEEHLVVTCGSTEAMLATLMSVVNPGDKVVVFSPFYENYGADTILSGAEPIYVSLTPPTYHFDRDELVAAFKQGAKAIIVCNPSNPSGKVFTREELQFIVDLAEEHDAFVIIDEVYEHIVYAPHEHTYAAALPSAKKGPRGARDRVIVTGSLSKTYSITGWRLGYVFGPADILKAVRKVHDFLTVGAAHPLQAAAVTALQFPDAYYAELQKAYDEKRDIFCGYLDQVGLTYTKPEGAYYVMVDASPLGYASDTELCKWLAKEIGVAAVPGSSFFREEENRYIRFHFAKKPSTLTAAGERLLKLKEKL